MKERNDLIRNWYRKARSDLIALHASQKAGALDAACFHAQQAVEKLLKSFLTHAGIDFPFTHNLAKLLQLCEKVDPAFKDLLPSVEPLTPYAVELRYDAEFWPSQEVANQAKTTAHEVLDFVIARLPTDITADNP